MGEPVALDPHSHGTQLGHHSASVSHELHVFRLPAVQTERALPKLQLRRGLQCPLHLRAAGPTRPHPLGQRRLHDLHLQEPVFANPGLILFLLLLNLAKRVHNLHGSPPVHLSGHRPPKRPNLLLLSHSNPLLKTQTSRQRIDKLHPQACVLADPQHGSHHDPSQR
jgi:hypothetical protein